MTNSKSTIIWAVDPFYTPVEPSPRILEVISAWNHVEKAPVKPVFVLNDISEKETWAHPDAREALNQLLKSLPQTELVEPEVVKSVDPPFTTRKLVSGLLQCAKSQSAKMIVVQSSNQSGAARLVFGSFAETLIQLSTVPVLLIKPQIRSTKTIQKILFATDFSQESKETFTKALAKAKEIGASLSVFHQEEQAEQEELESELLKTWKSEAKKLGLELDVLFGEGRGNKAEAILHAAEGEDVDLLVMASRSGGEGPRLGSTTVQVARRAQRPLYIDYPL